MSVSRHFLLQTPQCSCSVRKRFSRDHCCRGRSKPGCRIVGSHTRYTLTASCKLLLKCQIKIIVQRSLQRHFSNSILHRVLQATSILHQKRFSAIVHLPMSCHSLKMSCHLHQNDKPKTRFVLLENIRTNSTRHTNCCYTYTRAIFSHTFFV